MKARGLLCPNLCGYAKIELPTTLSNGVNSDRFLDFLLVLYILIGYDAIAFILHGAISVENVTFIVAACVFPQKSFKIAVVNF
ncbi:MAG: hypothetical protein RMY28_001635 [Nostoc sp. ChiSLP01]|nr:hypothetical protein [Nostoc sp. CmiSLP01]MDZ8285405.1 hypothetical protein [Nostoc sp. ChiSLP01]